MKKWQKFSFKYVIYLFLWLFTEVSGDKAQNGGEKVYHKSGVFQFSCVHVAVNRLSVSDICN